MGIFKWIMSLLRRKKNKAREHTPSKRVISNVENKTDNKEKTRSAEQSPCEWQSSMIEKKAPENVLSPVNEPNHQKTRRRRRQPIPTETLQEVQQFEMGNVESVSNVVPVETDRVVNTEANDNTEETVDCVETDSSTAEDTVCEAKEYVTVEEVELEEVNAELCNEDESKKTEDSIETVEIEEREPEKTSELVECIEEDEALEERKTEKVEETKAAYEGLEVNELTECDEHETDSIDIEDCDEEKLSEQDANGSNEEEIQDEEVLTEEVEEEQLPQIFECEENAFEETEAPKEELINTEDTVTEESISVLLCNSEEIQEMEEDTVEDEIVEDLVEDANEEVPVVCEETTECQEEPEEEQTTSEDDEPRKDVEAEEKELTAEPMMCSDDEKKANVDADILEEKADKKERKVVKGELYQEKRPVQRRVISEEEQLRKYILEQFYVQPLLGSIDVSRTEFEYVLMPWFKKRVRYVLYGTNALGGIDPVFCVCLVQIAMRDSKHGEFWNHVAKRLGYSKPTQTMTSRFGEIFIKTMKAHKKIVFDSGEKVASILMHCFVCDHHIPKLFDFLYAYYELDLYRHLELADVKALRDVMVSGKYYTRKQLILQQTEDVLKHLPELAIERFERYLTWIDKAYFDEKYQLESVGRFAEAFRKWRDNHPDFCMGRNEKGMTSRKGQKMFSSPQMCLNLKDGRFNVVFPRQKIPFECDEAQWEIVTSSIKYVECEITEAITSNLTEETWSSFASADLLGRIQFRLVAGGNVLRTFEIEQDCCRTFSDDGSLIKNKHLEAGTVYCFTHKDEQLITEATCTQQQTDDWLLSCYSFETGMTIDFPDGTFAIVGGEVGEGVCGSVPVSGAMIYDENRRPIPVYGRMPMLMLKTTQDKFLSGRMSLNGKYYSLENLSSRKVELGDRSDEDGYLITIPEKQHFIYDVSIDIAAENDVRKYCFAYMDGFSFRFENSGEPLPYLFVPRGSVTIFGNILLHGHDMEKHPRKNEFGFVLNAERQVLAFDVLNQNASLELEIPVVSYRFDQNEWRVQSPGEMWHTELPEKIEFRIPGKSLELSVDADADLRKQSVVYSRAQNEETIICDLMSIRSWLGREMFRHDIDLTIDGNRRHFAAVYARSAVFSARLEADYENNVLRGVFDIVGKSRYVVSLFHGEKIVAEQIAVEDGEIIVELPDDVGLYKAVVYEVEEDEFGFGEQLYKIGEAECELIDPGNIEGKTFYIKSLLTLDRKEEILPICHKRYWIDVLSQREDENLRYNGRLRVVDLWGAADPVPIVITLRKKTKIDQVQIVFIEDDEEQPFLYDYAAKAIVRNENMDLHRMERYRRYTMLDHEDLFGVIYM